MMMKTAGQLLQDERLKQKRTIRDISQKTHIKEEYIDFLEKNQIDQLPSGPFVRGFFVSYARELGLDSERIVAVYRRDFGQRDTKTVAYSGVMKPLSLGTKKKRSSILFGIGIVLLIIGAFIFFRIQVFHRPPTLVVLEPVENQSFQGAVVVRGHTETDAVVLINTQTVSMNQDGEFGTELSLSPGTHLIVVEAKNRTGKSTIVKRSITVVH